MPESQAWQGGISICTTSERVIDFATTCYPANTRTHGLQITLRVWRATYAGPDTGTIVLSAERPNLAAVATISDSVKKNQEIAAEMKKINGMRKIVSDSLYDLQTN